MPAKINFDIDELPKPAETNDVNLSRDLALKLPTFDIEVGEYSKGGQRWEGMRS